MNSIGAEFYRVRRIRRDCTPPTLGSAKHSRTQRLDPNHAEQVKRCYDASKCICAVSGDEVEIDAVHQRVIVDRSGVRSDFPQGFEV